MKTHKENNFDIIRLFAASLVIISHSFGFAGKDDILAAASGYTSLGILGVYIFFIISGHLISQSFLSRGSVKGYFIGRLLRIYPALIAIVLFTIFVAGPICTTLSLKDYFSATETWKYFWNLSLIKLHYYLPGVFIHNGIQKVVNAPLWTLVFEFAMYVLVAVYGILGLLRRTTAGIIFQSVILLAMLSLLVYPVAVDEMVMGFNVKQFSRLYIYFFIGALVGYYHTQIKFNGYITLLLGVIWILTFKTKIFEFTSIAFLTYAVFYVAYYTKSFGRFITKHGDFSYGTYLYGYLMQNIILNFFGVLAVWQMIIASFVFTAPFAFLSWKFIESKALDYKKVLIEKLPVSRSVRKKTLV